MSDPIHPANHPSSAVRRREIALRAGPCDDGLRRRARFCLDERDPDRKVAMTQQMLEALQRGDLAVESGEGDAGDCMSTPPGLPPGLQLTSPTKVRRRGFGSIAGRIAFVHSIAHIEWNAINLAWDAVWRFGPMPRAYYEDWARVAAEEARHFSMLRGRLRELGSEYGELPAHDGLWQTAETTRHDVLARMALVPRVLEARGLDVTPGLIAKLREHGDEATAAILDVVLRDEVGHVLVGSQWFHHLCRERGLEPAAAFEAEIRAHFRGRTSAVLDPVSRRLRIEAGFLEEEFDALARLATQGPPGGGA